MADQTRQSVVIRKFGGPECLALETEAVQPLTPGTFRVALKMLGVNRADVLLRKGQYHGTQLPARPGLEGAGVVMESAASIPVGARVLVFANRTGLYTTDVVCQESEVALLPDAVTFEQAAALPINWLTAAYCVKDLLQVQSGETVLVTAAGSGVGLAAIQIAKDCGARVMASASSDEKLKVARECGADVTVNLSREGVSDAVARETGGKGVQAAMDIVGGPNFRECLKSIGDFGRVVALANVTLEDTVMNTRDFYPKNARIFGFQYGKLLASGRIRPKPMMEAILQGVAFGNFRPVMDQVFPLKDVARAHERLESRGVIGKVLLRT